MFLKNNYIQKIFANRSVLAYCVCLVVMFLALLIGFDFLLEAQTHAEATEKKIETMRKATETFDQKKVLLDKAVAKPITNDKIDEVQTGILLMLQRHNLSLDNMNSISNGEQKEKNLVFEIAISGTYDDTVAFLSSFRKEAKALISILAVHFNPDKSIIRTTIKYKVYVR